MTEATTGAPRVNEVIQQLGCCLELVSMDPHFHEITVGLYVKGDVATVWSYSRKPGVEKRIRQIRDRLVILGGLVPIEGTENQARFACGQVHARPMRFLLSEAVERDPAQTPPDGPISMRDSKSALTLHLAGRRDGGRHIYTVTAEGEAPNPALRIRAIVGGFMRYGEMVRVSPTEAAFPCGVQHDELARLLLPFARNVSAVDDMLEAADMRGQLTTQTLGFSQSM